MGKYSREYKDYYKKIGKDRDKISKINKRQDKRYYVKKFIYQVVGAVVLLGLLFILKNIPLKEGNDIYVFSKNTLNNDINIKNYKERILDKIDDISTYKNMGIINYRLELFDEDEYQVKELINRF